MKTFDSLDKALRLRSERLYLKPITEEDTKLVLSFRNADYVRENFFYRKLITEAEHLDFFHNKCEKGQVFYFLVYVAATDEPIGCVYLQHYEEKDDSLESGVFFSENAPKGCGYATEAVRMMNDYAFRVLGVSKTIARVIATNQSSLSLHLRTGFKESMRSFEKVIPTGEMVEAVTFELFSDCRGERNEGKQEQG